MTPDDEAPAKQTNISTGGGDYAEGDIDKRRGEVFVGGDVHGTVIGHQTNKYYPPLVTPLDRQQQRNRRAMLQKVKAIWIDGLLEQSLAKELRIALDLTTQPDAVNLPLNALVQELNQPARTLLTGTPIIDVFDQMGGALLILGAPGAGKTTLLLELCRGLIGRAEQDEGHPIPVVFNLSSWATKRRPLKEWLVEELNTKYDVPRKMAQAWVNTDAVLPLLDGLDEVAAEHRAACVQAINTYRQDHGLVPLAVCSRVVDYEALAANKLRLQGAIVVQQLTTQQVAAYLERAGEKVAGIRAALHEDAELHEMLDTPLMLSIVALAYAGKPAAEVQAAGTPEERRRHLFDAYIEAMFKRRSQETRYPQQRTLHWLCWLAHQMTWQNQTEFFVERLQPDWLPTRAMQFQYVVLDRLVGGLLVGQVYGLGVGLVSGLLGGVVFGLVFGLVILFFGGETSIDVLQQHPLGRTIWDGLAGGLVFGLVGGLVGGAVFGLADGLVDGAMFGVLGVLIGVLTGKPGVSLRQVIVVERLRWVWGKASRSAVSGIVVGLAFGLIFGLTYSLVVGLIVALGGGLLGLLGGPLVELIIRLMNGPGGRSVFVLLSVLYCAVGAGMFGGLLGGLSAGQLTATIRVNQGIRRSARSALVVGLLGALLGVLLSGLLLGPLLGVVGAVGIGVISALSFGGYACLSHLALRLVLYFNNFLPLRLTPFFDYCVDRIFLRRVGGGYIFVHRLLMEHFASLYDETDKAKQ